MLTNYRSYLLDRGHRLFEYLLEVVFRLSLFYPIFKRYQVCITFECISIAEAALIPDKVYEARGKDGGKSITEIASADGCPSSDFRTRRLGSILHRSRLGEHEASAAKHLSLN